MNVSSPAFSSTFSKTPSFSSQSALMNPIKTDWDNFALTAPLLPTKKKRPSAIIHHGSFIGSETMNGVAESYSNRGYRVYNSFLPEVQYATGIVQTKPEEVLPPSGQPAYIMMLRDLGDLRLQLLAPQVKDLASFHKSLPTAKKDRNEQLVSQFDIPSQWAPWLGPILEREVLLALGQPPENLKKTYQEFSSLLSLLDRASSRLAQEAQKVLSPGEKAPDIIDSGFFEQKAREKGRQLNLDVFRYFYTNSIVNLRPVDIALIGQVERYLLAIEENLRKAIGDCLASPRMQMATGRLSKEKRSDIADELAHHIIEQLVSPGIAFGYSQGGATVHAALLHHLLEGPKTLVEAKKMEAKEHAQNQDHQDEEPAEKIAAGNLSQSKIVSSLLLSGEGIGWEDLRSTPLSGIPMIPDWVVPAYNVLGQVENTLRIASQPLTGFARAKVWGQFQKGRPAILEMMRGSELMRWFSKHANFHQNIPASHHAISSTSTFDKKDGFMQSIACKLQLLEDEMEEESANRNNGTPPSFQEQRERQKGQQNLVEEAEQAIRQSDAAMISIPIGPDGKPAANFFYVETDLEQITHKTASFDPKRVVRLVRKASSLTPLTRQVQEFLLQHRATINFMDEVNAAHYTNWVETPENLHHLLVQVGFAPLQRQIMALWRQRTQKALQEGLKDNFSHTLLQQSDILAQAFCTQATKASPFTVGQREEAYQTIHQLLNIVQAVMGNPATQGQVQRISQALATIQEADLPDTVTIPSPSKRAGSFTPESQSSKSRWRR